MDSIRKISRRRFLALTGLTSSGIVLMGSLPATALAGVLDEPAGQSLNLFVSVQGDGTVEIIAHRSEMGTGIRTSLPQVVADEMEADWAQVKVIQGLANADYGSQNTDGSRSIRNFYHIMRQMGAAAKAMLEQAAANQWSAKLSDVSAREHRVNHRDGRSLGFGELAAAAASLPMPALDSLTLKDKQDFRYIGKSVPIVDLDDICTGNTTYGVDVRVPGMLFASIERTPVLQGKAVSYDEAAARKLPGVVDVIKMEGSPLPSAYNALEGVAVLATDTYSAMQGRSKLNVQWNTGEHGSYDSASYLEGLARAVSGGPGVVQRERGDTDAALKAAEKTLEATYKAPYLAHASMEPPMATAHIHDGICEIWACTQTPQSTQRTVADVLGLEPAQVKVHVTLLGGGFGRKSKPDFSVEAALLAKATGKPVQVVWTREDDIHQDYFHSCSAQHFKGGLDNSGVLSAWLAREATPTISSTFDASVDIQSGGSLGQSFGTVPFAVPNLRIESHKAPAHMRIGWLRSVYNIPYAFGVGSFMDELAHAAGKDPRDFWLESIGEDRHITFAEEGLEFGNYGRSLEEYPYDTARFKRSISALTETLPWGEKLPAGQGWGLAAARSFLAYVAVACKVEVKDGRLRVLEMHTTIDAGTVVNPDRVHSQMEGAMIFGLSLALMGEITFEDGAAVQSNFHDYPVARINQTPDVIKTHIIPSEALPAGVGEPGVPPVAPSIANAIFAATGKRVREFPFNKQFTV
ncbi:xanthine dehydrogenase [Halioglobus japonicus]|uniref:Xanthine dehydrogenase family protein molybdopterin-binding subunit n=1 Tax=Halioglobus japonicus TaxID=930805 RepID=A0AAP8MH42_9GAMM|nr:molybdopterin cofactor-binding domain-containing protein [Halioglobus japonicus]PLW87382.1 xanthine dehydrogenase family protein molybdopterin-binding subunit [Halioglobus japonicus]GHD08770.1 xanthine dehydrogenase [Halioglobus japonicus]